MLAATGIYARRGAFNATITFAMTVISALAAFNYYQLPERFFVWIYTPFWPYADGMGLMFTFTLVFLLLQWFALNWLEERIDLNPVINAVGGALFGGLSSMLLAGILVISWLMMPGSALYMKGDSETGEAPVILGVDTRVLSTVRFVANERIPGSRSFDPTRSFMETHTYKQARVAAPRKRRPDEALPPGEAPGIGAEGDPTRRGVTEELDRGT